MPRLNTPIKYPIREWLGKYLSWRVKCYGWRAGRHSGIKLEKFFAHFPPQMGLEYFTIADLQEYREWRLNSGTKVGTLEIELTSVKAFWKWLIEDCQFPLFNPVRDEKIKIRKSRLTLAGFKRLVSFIDEPEIRDFLKGIAVGETRQCSYSPRVIGSTIATACQKAGLATLGYVELRQLLKSNLWRQAIHMEYSDRRPDVTEEEVLAILS